MPGTCVLVPNILVKNAIHSVMLRVQAHLSDIVVRNFAQTNNSQIFPLTFIPVFSSQRNQSCPY